MWKNISDFVSKHLEKIVLVLAVVLSVASFAYYYHAGLITAYGDSRGHLNIARRVVDNLTPGAAQFGGYWLPLLHILMLPTIWNDFMWQSGLSGSIPNMIAFVVAVLFMYRLALLVTSNKFSAFIAASVLLFNPNLLYMQATPMTESLFVCTITVFMFYFYRWFQEGRTPDIVLAALFLVLSSLNRYEGWGLVIAANVLMVWHWVQHKFDKKIEGAMIAFGTLSFFGIFLWLLWGAVIFHDPLEFMHNNLSAGNQTALYDTWTGFHEATTASFANIYAVIHISGSLLFFMAIVVAPFIFLKNIRDLFKSETLLILLLLVPLLFDILTLYMGKVPIEVPELSKLVPPSDYFNIRYALYSLPIISIAIAALSAFFRNKAFHFLILFLVFIGCIYFGFFPKDNRIVVLKDAGCQPEKSELKDTYVWIKSHYDGGLILASTGGTDAWMFRTGIRQKNFITEGAYKYWDESLEDPSRYARWIIVSWNNPMDAVFRNINVKALQADFQKVHEVSNGSTEFLIFQRKEK